MSPVRRLVQDLFFDQVILSIVPALNFPCQCVWLYITNSSCERFIEKKLPEFEAQSFWRSLVLPHHFYHGNLAIGVGVQITGFSVQDFRLKMQGVQNLEHRLKRIKASVDNFAVDKD